MSGAMAMPSPTSSSLALSFLPAECVHCGRGGRAGVEPGMMPLHKGFCKAERMPQVGACIDTSPATSGMSVNDLISPFSNRYPTC